MANANLAISEELRDAFADAVADPAVRAIEVNVDLSELVMSPGEVWKVSQGVDEDYEVYLASKWDASRCQLFFLRTSESKWISVVFAPDTAPVRSRMLFASSLQQAREAFGSQHLDSGRFHAADDEEASGAAFVEWRSKTVSSALTDAEKVRRAMEVDEARAISEAASSSTSSGGVVYFKVADGLVPALRSFAEGSLAGLRVQIDMAEEVMAVVDSVPSSEAPGAVLLAKGADPCFVLLSRAAVIAAAGKTDGPEPTEGAPAGCVLVYYCPEDAPVRTKMVHSTAKATVLQQCRFEAGVVFSSLLEVGEAEELVADITRLLHEEEEKRAKAAAVTLATGASVSSSSGFGKPSRPGRRRRRT